MALALIVGLLAFPAAGVAAVKAPVGTWAGPTGESETDYGVLSIADAAGGTQKAIFFEKETNPCGLKPGIMYATATLDGETVWLRGDFYCPNTGELVIGDLEIHVAYTVAGTMYWGQVGEVDIEWKRACPSGPTSPGDFGPNTTIIKGTNGDDTLIGTAGDDLIIGKAGNDTLIGSNGFDILCGGPGDDLLKGGRGIDVMIGNDGNDRARGGPNWDFGTGGNGRDILKGSGGTDYLHGDADNDRIFGLKGANDVAVGGGGVDVCVAEVMIGC